MHIGPNCIGKKRRTAGGGEDDMREQAGEGVGHSYAPLGLRCEMQPLYPRLAPWGYRLLPAVRAGPGYFRALPAGGMTAAPTAAPESSPANHCRSSRIQKKPLAQYPERRVNPVDPGGVLQVRQPVHFLPRGADPPRQSYARTSLNSFAMGLRARGSNFASSAPATTQATIPIAASAPSAPVIPAAE